MGKIHHYISFATGLLTVMRCVLIAHITMSNRRDMQITRHLFDLDTSVYTTSQPSLNFRTSRPESRLLDGTRPEQSPDTGK
jgi:hypothetical protein